MCHNDGNDMRHKTEWVNSHSVLVIPNKPIETRVSEFYQ